jgi:hypothetical protein
MATEDLSVSYHQQDTDYYCGAACAQMVLDSVAAGLLPQDQLYNDNHSHSTIESGWATAPDGLQWSMNHYAPPAPPGPPHYGYYDFVIFALGSEDLISRKIVWTIHNYRVAPIALVYGWAHWIVVRGYSATAEPTSYDDVSYSIESFDVNNPWPPVPSFYGNPPPQPPPHADGADGCADGGSTRGIADENISYAMWQSTYMTGVPGGYWAGQFVAVCDPEPPPTRRGRPSRPLVEPLNLHGQLLAPKDVASRATQVLGSYGLLQRERFGVFTKLAFSEPILVQRLDLPDSFYYIIGAGESQRVQGAVMLDAKTGNYLQSAVHADPKGSLFAIRPRAEVARSIIGTTVELPNLAGLVPIRQEAVCQYPTMVWKPCRQSLSPLYPFHLFTVGEQRIYVRIDGKVFTQLDAPWKGM